MRVVIALSNRVREPGLALERRAERGLLSATAVCEVHALRLLQWNVSRQGRELK